MLKLALAVALERPPFPYRAADRAADAGHAPYAERRNNRRDRAINLNLNSSANGIEIGAACSDPKFVDCRWKLRVVVRPGLEFVGCAWFVIGNIGNIKETVKLPRNG